MTLLLDTHIFLWYVTEDPRLSEDVRQSIKSGSHAAFLSVASLWECVIKHQIGKLPLPGDAWQFLEYEREQHRIEPLIIDPSTIRWLLTLPSIHRDPFDRLMAAHALQYDLTLVTDDRHLRKYPVKLYPPN